MRAKSLLSCLLAVLCLGSAKAQEPEHFHPLWEDLGPAATASSFPLIGEGNPAPEPLPGPPPSGGYGIMSVPASVNEEIARLAAALGNDPVRIFNHVRNTIDYEHYYGLRKGPELTLLEGSGNDLDTCTLLAELLKAAGHTDIQFWRQARRVHVTGNNGKNVNEWFGLADEPFPGQTFAQVYGVANPWPVSDLEAKRTFYALDFITSRHTDFRAPWLDYTSIAFTRFWLKLTYQGVTYDLDPSFKRYETVEGIDLKELAGYLASGQDRNALLAAAGGSTGSGFVANLNGTNIGDFLSARTSDLLASLAAQYPGATVEEIIKGRRIIKEDITDLSQAFPLPRVGSSAGVSGDTDGYGTPGAWDSIASLPSGYKSTVSFTTGSLNHSMPAADLKGQKVSLAASGNEVQLWLDDQKVAWTTVTASTYSFTMTVTHPGVGARSQTKTYKKHNQYVYALIYGFNSSGRLIQKRHEELARYLEADPEGDDRAARSEILNIMGLTWMYQTGLSSNLLAAQNDMSTVNYHRFGRMAQEEGFYVDVGLQLSSTLSRDGVAGDRFNNAFHLDALIGSAMEHGIIEQMQPGNSAISTVNVIRHANTAGYKRTYVIDNALVTSGSPWNSAKTALAAYNNNNTKNGRYDDLMEPYTDSNANGRWDSGEPYTDLTELKQFEHVAQNGGIVILPHDRTVTKSGWQWVGSGWVLRMATRAGMIISGDYSGGWSTNYGYVAPAPVTNWGSYNPTYSYSPPSYTGSYYTPPSYSSPSFFGSDPVDMATGAFTLANDDLTTGTEAAPRGLSFSRHYTSNSADRDGQRIGHGWTHSLHIRAVERTASEESLGLGSPRQAAAFITMMAIASDLYRDGATPKEMTTAILAVGWYLDQLTNNAVTVEIGGQQIQFTRKPDGGYEPPPGSTMSLEKIGTAPSHTYRLRQRHANEFVFEKEAGNTDGSAQRIKEIVDPDGKKMIFTYLSADPANRLNYVQAATTTGSANLRYKFRYDSNNRIDRVTESINSTDGRYIGFSYDADGNLLTYTDPEGKATHYDYEVPSGQSPADPSGTTADQHLIVRHRNHDGEIITQNVYDSLGRVYEQYLHGDTAKTWKLSYTGFANTEEDPEGGITTYFYDDRGRATGKRDASGVTETWVYDGQDRVFEKTTGSGETTIIHYDSRNNITRIDHPRGGGSTQMFYDSLDRQDLTIDPDGNETDYVYNSGNTANRPDQITDPEGTTTYQYKTSGAAIGRVWKVTDDDNLLTEYEYDSNGNPDWLKEPGGFQTQFTYSARGDLEDVTDPNNVKTSYLYNDRRQVTKITTDQGGANESVEDFVYNNQGLLERKTEAADNGGQRFATRYEYSPTEKQRFLRTSDNDGEGPNDPTTEVIYDGRDWQHESIDPGARSTVFTPRANGQPWKTTIPLVREKIQVQDGDGRPTGGTVPGSSGTRSSSILYDVAPSGYPRTLTTTADNLSVNEVQDRRGNPRFYTNRKSNVWEFRHDGLGRRTHVITPLDAAASRAHVTEYHHRGAVKTVTEPSGQVTNFTYDPTSGRLTGVSDGVGTISHTAYDNNGNLLTTTETRTGTPGTKTTGRTYDRQDRLASRTDENGQQIEYRHYPSGKLWKIIYPGGSENGTGHVEYTWWQSGQLKDVIDKLDSTTSPRTTSYFWNKDGRLAKVQRDNGTVREVKYDAAGRPDVIEEYGPDMKLIFVHKHGFYPSDEMAWRYTLPAKRTSGNDPPAMLAMTYNADNQLATWGGQTIIHDADGNMTSGPAPDGSSLAGYSYDSRNRLVSALGTSYTYDADGQRVGMVKGADTTTFVTDVSSKLSKVLVRTKNGVPTRYVWGLGLLYEVNGSGGSATTVSYHHDATGSTIALSDDTGKVIERIGYTPWGQINHRANLGGTPHDTPFLFTGFFGNQTDGNGLLYMRARYYHPQLGRFLNADPAQEGMNWYGYAGGNPIGMVDPMGLGIESVLDSVQTVLSFLGMTPVFGAVFDVVNAGISIGRGNYVDAAMNLASAIPGIGDFAAGAKLIGGGAALYGGWKGVSFVADNYTVGSRLFSGVPSFVPKANNIVYQSFHAGTTTVNYVGITNNFARRSAEHFNSARNLTITPIQGLSNLTRSDARAVEQVLINHHGLSRSGGSLLNLINSIAPNNPFYRSALTRGEQLLKSAGYSGF